MGDEVTMETKMNRKYFVILTLIISLLLLSSVASASEKNEVGVDLEYYRHYDSESGVFEAGDYSRKKELWFSVWNWNDPSEENINEIRLIFYPEDSGQIGSVEVENGELESAEPYIAVGRAIPLDSGIRLHIWGGEEETTFVPISVRRDVDVSYFETTGKQFVTVTVTPQSGVDSFSVSIINTESGGEVILANCSTLSGR